MNKNIAWITLTIGLIFSLLILKLSPLNSDTAIIALLPSLFITELGLLSTLYGSYVSYKAIKSRGATLPSIVGLVGNLFLVAGLIILALKLWQYLSAS